MEKKFLVPAAGLKVIDLKTSKPLPAEGVEVEMTSYWQRRINDGDVTVGAPPAPVAKKTATKN